jgi:poly(beta-D-mannuronate) lyase
MNHPIRLLLAALLLLPAAGFAQTNIDSLNKAVRAAKPGDTLVIANGTYRDVSLNFFARGDAARPIVVRAATVGGVRLTGTSTLRLAGTGIEVQGLHFTSGYAPAGAAIEFRSGRDVANGCRITQCAIDDYNPPAREMESSWILLYGRNNRFDHNSVSGKRNLGVTFAVILDEERNQQNNHSIDFNWFGPRPNLGSNGGETIRVGTSQSSLSSSRTQIVNNFFEACDGEVEVVSIKSCDNVIRNNTFFESAGVLALRHGHRNLVEGNAFIGNGKPNTGGVRIINEGHTIRNNYFSGLTGDRFFAALAIMNAVPNSLPNRYHQVKDVTISNNTWVDCDHIQFHVGKDNERTLAPENVTLSNNTFYNTASDVVYVAFDKTDGFHFSGNKVRTRSGHYAQPGFTETKMAKPVNGSGAVDRVLCGAAWYQPVQARQKRLSGRKIEVKAGQNTILKAVAGSYWGDVLQLTDTGTYLLDAGVVIHEYLRIEGAGAQRAKIRFNGRNGKTALFTIGDGGTLELRHLAFDNDAFDGLAAATAAVAPAAQMAGSYSATIDDCEFYNYTEGSMSPFKAARNSYADTLRFTNCLFRDMSGDAIYLAAEKDDAGRYSAEYVEIRNCSFYKVLGHSVDLYRGGSDESTTGPNIIVDHCVLEDVNNRERGAGMRLLGVQNITVRNTLFSNTGRGGASIRLDETNWDKIAITNCNLYNSGRVASFWGHVIKGPMFSQKPAYRGAAQYDFHLKNGNALSKSATDGGPIGLQP